MYNNFIFDLYGTLVDIHTNESKPSLYKNLAAFMTLQGASYMPNELKSAYKKHCTRVRNFYFGFTSHNHPEVTPDEIEIDLKHVITALYKDKGITPTEDMIKTWGMLFRSLSTDYFKLFDGVEKTLDTLHANGKNVYLLSNAQRLFTEPEILSLGLDKKLDAIFISSDIGFMKPSKYFYDSLFEQAGISKDDSVMIGNEAVADCMGAHNYGIDSMYVHTSQSPKKDVSLPENCIKLKSIKDVIKHM